MTLRPSVCAKCEDKNRPVSEVNGFSFHYEVVKDMCVELFLHDKFSSKWYDAFTAGADH
jgi:hypothetical protein